MAPTKKKKRFIRWMVFGGAGLVLGILGIGAILLVGLPDGKILRNHYPALLISESGTLMDVTFQKSRPRVWVSLSNISSVAVEAVRVSEDWNFYEHNGLDLFEIKESIKKNFSQGRYARGASTITQQVARNLFLVKDKTLRRKIREIILARRLERNLSKAKILETYLNIAEWGEGIFGIRRASQLYFGKDPIRLTAKEGAFLAMLLPNPKTYSSSFRDGQLSPYAEKTVRSILRKLHRAGYLTPDEFERERERPLPFESDYHGGGIEPYFESEVF